MEDSITTPLANQSMLRDNIGESILFNQIQTTSPLQPANPPTYPCSERCIKCNQSPINQPTVNGHQVENSESEQTQTCECECHKQDHETQQLQTQIPKDNVEDIQNPVQVQDPLQMTANHIPPGGPNCLPGCGYSGLPCYNCSMGPAQPPGTTQTSSATQGYFGATQSPNQNPGYPVQPQGYPQIYTVDLMNNSRMNQDGLSQTQVLIAEEQGRRSRKRYCLSIIVSVIAINIAIAFFRMMIRGTVSRY